MGVGEFMSGDLLSKRPAAACQLERVTSSRASGITLTYISQVQSAHLLRCAGRPRAQALRKVPCGPEVVRREHQLISGEVE